MYVVDTNIILDYPDILLSRPAFLPYAVVDEIDKLKNSDAGYKARKAAKLILENLEKIKIVKDTCKDKYIKENSVDDHIINFAKDNNYTIITNDIILTIKANNFKIPVEHYAPTKYLGHTSISGNTEEINNFFASHQPLVNEYIICRNVDTGKESEMRYNGKSYVNLTLPRFIKGYNAKQRCALDLLYNKNIPIKIIVGMAGSGKTKLSISIAEYFLKQGHYDGIVLVRNPIGSGKEVGFLKGAYEEKIEKFFNPMTAHLEDDFNIIKEIPFYMKGLTYTNKFILVDEAEDLDIKTLRLIGTRVGKNSCIVFAGDYKQTESYYLKNNGLIEILSRLAGDPEVGIVVFDSIEDDVRSDISKIFAKI